MKAFAVSVAGRYYYFTDRVTAEHFIKKCKLAENSLIQEIVLHHPSMIDALAETIDSSQYV